MTSISGICDACGMHDTLQGFSLEASEDGCGFAGPLFRLCDTCEARFLAAVEPFIGEDEARALRREEVAA